MKVINNTNGRGGNKPLLTLMAIAASACIAQGQTGFLEDFAGPTLDTNVWTVANYPAGHLGIIGGSYYMTAKQGGGFNPKLVNNNTAGPLNTSTHEISVVLNPFFLAGSGGTQSDFKWKNFGADGFMEIVLNSFGDMRMYHNDFSGGAGNIQPNTNIGPVADGDVLDLKTVYDSGTDTINVTYEINGGGAVAFYSGGGIDGPIGDTIGNFVEVEVFKWGAVVDEPFIGIDEWNLTVVPEPTTAALFGLGSLSLLALRRRR